MEISSNIIGVMSPEPVGGAITKQLWTRSDPRSDIKNTSVSVYEAHVLQSARLFQILINRILCVECS